MHIGGLRCLLLNSEALERVEGSTIRGDACDDLTLLLECLPSLASVAESGGTVAPAFHLHKTVNERTFLNENTDCAKVQTSGQRRKVKNLK